MCRPMRPDENYRRRLIMLCVLLDLCSCSKASLASPSPDISTPERCHPEDVLLTDRSNPCRRVAGRAAQVDKLVLGVAQGVRYEASLRLVKLGFTVHEEWLQFQGAAEQDGQAQRISFAVPPLPAGRYKEHFDVYDACGLSASLSACNEDDQRLRLLCKMNIVVDVDEAVQGHSIYPVSVPLASAAPLPESSVCKVQTFNSPPVCVCVCVCVCMAVCLMLIAY